MNRVELCMGHLEDMLKGHIPKYVAPFESLKS